MEKIRHLTALWQKKALCTPLLAACHLGTPQGFGEREREQRRGKAREKGRVRERENRGSERGKVRQTGKG